jgi:hypothetical protein
LAGPIRWSVSGLGFLLSLSARAEVANVSAKNAWLGQALEGFAGIAGDWINNDALAGFT